MSNFCDNHQDTRAEGEYCPICELETEIADLKSKIEELEYNLGNAEMSATRAHEEIQKIFWLLEHNDIT